MYAFDLLLTVAGLLIVVFGGDPIVRVVLQEVEKSMTTPMKKRLEKESIPNAGRFIGYLERALVFVLVIGGQSGSIAFIIAAKAIIRFESSRHRPFAEYFLVGTFSSMLVTLAVSSMFLLNPIIPWR